MLKENKNLTEYAVRVWEKALFPIFSSIESLYSY